MMIERSNNSLKSKPTSRKTIVFIALLIAFIVYLLWASKLNPNSNQYIDPRESAVETLVIEGLQDIKEINLVDDLGAIPDDDQDDSPAFQEALDMATKEPIRLIIPAGEYLSIGPGNLEAVGIKGLHIQGEGAVIKPENPMINPLEYYFMKLFMAENNKGVKIEGITIDGSLNPQDLYFTLERPEDVFDLQLQRGFYIDGALDVAIHDTRFQHMYGGYAIHLSQYNQVNIQDIVLDDVGGDDITDSFGMAIYLGGHTGDAVVNIDKVRAIGKVSDRDPSYTAWIGVVLENGSIQSDNREAWLIDDNTTLNITNSVFLDYETTFHIESMAGNVYWNVDNIVTRAKNYLIAAGVNGELKERSHNIQMEMTPWGRNDIIHGLYYTEKERDDNISGVNEFSMYNSVITYLTLDDYNPIPMATSYGDSVKATYSHVTLNDVPEKLVVNGSAIFIDSQINLHANSIETAESLSQGPFSEPDVQEVQFQGSTTINPFGSHQIAEQGDKPQWYIPSGYQAPELEDPISGAELTGE